jgi:large subunit ribosomal protein L29
MKMNELREMSTEELTRMEAELRDELFRLRMLHYTGQLDRPSDLGKRRKTIARVCTLLSERTSAVA